MISRLINSSFAKNVTLLASGTAVAQLLVVASSPLLTRLYSPEDFGMVAIFIAMVASLSQAVCGKYEVAIVVPKNNRTGIHLLGIAIYFSFLVSFVAFFILIFAEQPIVELVKADQLGVWLFITPLALLLTGLLNAFNYFSNRKENYKLIAQTTMVRAIGVLFINLVFGVLGVGGVGLIFGNVVGLALAVVFIGLRQRTFLNRVLFDISITKWNILKKYSDYPKYNATTGLLNGILVAMPIFFLNRYFTDQTVGYFALVIKVATTPTAFISSAVSQVNLKKVVDLVNNGKPVVRYIYKLSFLLFIGVSLPAVVLIVWAPDIFSFIFGPSWERAGVYLQILMPALAIKFVSSTLSTTLGATKNNRLGAIWKIIAFLSTGIVLSWYAPQNDIHTLLIAILINDIFLYVLYYYFIILAAKRADTSRFNPTQEPT